MKTPEEIREYIDSTPQSNGHATDFEHSNDNNSEAGYGSHRLKPLLLSELQSLPPRQYLIKRLLGVGEFSVWFGPPGCGKSFLMMQTGLLVAQGLDWWGRKTRPGFVVYIAAEGGSGMTKRIRAYLDEHGLNAGDVPFAIIPAPPNFGTSANGLDGAVADCKVIVDYVKALEAKLKKSCVLIVVDTLNRSLNGGDENSSQAMGAFISSCDYLRNQTGAHVAAVHHTSKDGAKEPRGHSSLMGAVDTAVSVEKRGSGNAATVRKNKDDEDGWSIGFRLRQVTIGEDEDGDPETSCVLVESDEVPDARSKPLPPNQKIAVDALNEVLIKEGLPVHNQNGIPEGAVCVDEEAWRVEFIERKDGDSIESKKRVFRKALGDLRANGRIGYRGDKVWLVQDRQEDV